MRVPMVTRKSGRHLLVQALLVSILIGAGAPLVRADDTSQRTPQVEWQGIELKGVDLSKRTADVLISVVVKNPGPAFKLTDLNYKLRLNGVEIADGRFDKEVEIKGEGETVVALPFTFDLTGLPGVAWNSMTDSLTLRYELDTEFTIPLFASLKHTQKSSFKGDFPIGAAITAFPGKLKERLFGKP